MTDISELPDSLDDVAVVLVEPQDDINIGNTVRACKNFGIFDIRLVRPAQADPERIAISAPKAGDLIERVQRFETLSEAIAGRSMVIGTTARQRSARRIVTEPRGAAETSINAVREGGSVAYLFGREDSGLSNEALDRTDSVVTIPTNPAYTSLNLGQAVLLNVWELFRVAADPPVERPDIEWVRAERERSPPEAGMRERMFEQAERALKALDFFKTDETWNIMRTLRSIFMRAGLDDREVSIWLGIFSEIESTVQRLRGESSSSSTETGESDDQFDS